MSLRLVTGTQIRLESIGVKHAAIGKSESFARMATSKPF
ncbi:hypothetical protein GV51_0640 [Gardnerella vaginalis 5-1]|nr:hypothetical protein GV51_0640 [Gardnerella vaginalis 5-1]